MFFLSYCCYVSLFFLSLVLYRLQSLSARFWKLSNTVGRLCSVSWKSCSVWTCHNAVFLLVWMAAHLCDFFFFSWFWMFSIVCRMSLLFQSRGFTWKADKHKEGTVCNSALATLFQLTKAISFVVHNKESAGQTLGQGCALSRRVQSILPPQQACLR